MTYTGATRWIGTYNILARIAVVACTEFHCNRFAKLQNSVRLRLNGNENCTLTNTLNMIPNALQQTSYIEVYEKSRHVLLKHFKIFDNSKLTGQNSFTCMWNCTQVLHFPIRCSHIFGIIHFYFIEHSAALWTNKCNLHPISRICIYQGKLDASNIHVYHR